MAAKEVTFVNESEISEFVSEASSALPNKPSAGQLKRQRGAAKGVLTKKRNEIESRINQFECPEEGDRQIAELETALEMLGQIHAAFHETLSGEEEIQDSVDYFQYEEAKVKDLTARIKMSCSTCVKQSEQHSTPTVEPCDSVSKAGSKNSSASSVSSARAKATARKAKLLAEASALKKIQQIQKEELKLQQTKQELEMKKQIAMAEAEERVLAEAEGNHELSDVKVSAPLTSYVHSLMENNEGNAHEQPAITVTAKPDLTKPEPEDNKDWYGASSFQPVYYPTHPMAYLQHMESLLTQQQQHTLALMLPQPELPVFGGDLIEYCSFIRAFESIIESKTDSSSTRLYYLIQYTSGDVNELMRSCLTMSAEEGYREARRLLKQRYGQDYRIAAAYVNRVTTGPPIRTDKAEDLRRFSVLITSFKNALKDIGYLGRINDPDCLKKIISRLPFDMRRKWRDIADDISECQRRDITIKDVALFIEKRARSASHPVFGEITPTKSGIAKPIQRSGGYSGGSSRKVFGTSGESKRNSDHGESRSRPQCPLCNNRHRLSQCGDFRSKSLEERMKITRAKGLCNNCLVTGHVVRDCPKDSFCKVDGCKSKHSTFLHPLNVSKGEQMQSERREGCDNSGPISSNHSSNCDREETRGQSGYVKCRENQRSQSSSTSLAIVPVKVKVPGCKRVVETYAFLDTGSNTTFCTEQLMQQLQAKGTETTLTLTTLGVEDDETKTSVFSLQVSDLEENNTIELPLVFTTPQLPVTTDNRANRQDIHNWSHLQAIPLFDIDADVGLLIGSDVPRALEPKEVKSGQPGEPYATRTELGWTINGPLKRTRGSRHTTNLINTDAELSAQFERYCNMEFNDSCYDANASMSQEDKRALEKMKASIQLVNGHYEISLPWKDGCPNLPNNRPMAEQRLLQLMRRLSKEPILLQKYTDFMDELLTKGYARRPPQQENEGQVTWFLPHHPVFHPKKPEKTRVVFDCSAKFRNTSLNGQLSQGPDFTNSLIGVLTRFRTGPVALMADVEGMFLQVQVPLEDANALRFLWWPNRDLSSDPKEYQMLVHLFGATSSPSCANFALQQTTEDNRDDFDPATVKTVKRNFYVDDCLKSVESDYQAINLQGELRQLLSRGGFRLTKWVSNSIKVLESVPESERAPKAKDLDLGNSAIERALGVRWNVPSDTFGFKISIKDKQPTRRGILSIVSSTYDPLGFAAPFILPAKAILQDLCRQKLGWDEEIPERDFNRWQDWLADLPKLEGYVIDRCIKPREFGEVTNAELHHFSDASDIGYGAVSYLRITNSDGEVHCCLMMAKSRLAPIKPVTTPRMELSAAVVATRLDTMLRRELGIDIKIDRSYFWTDSTCVLRYTENDVKRFQTFVANRVASIRNVSVPSQWRYVDTKTNPADDTSRGLSADNLIASKRWHNAPEFLWKPEEDWPKRPSGMGNVEDNDPEVKRSERSARSFATEAQTEVKEATTVDDIIKQFSSWRQLKKTVAWLLRYKTNLKTAKGRRQQGEAMAFGEIRPIDVEEMKSAEKEILKFVQRQSFPTVMAALSLKPQKEKEGIGGRRNTMARNRPLRQLDPFLSEDGLLRVGGRLGRAPISDEARHQIILPKYHHVVNLIGCHYHQASGHSGLEYVLSLIRERYWNIKARPTLRRILSTCFSCRKRQGPAEEQKWPIYQEIVLLHQNRHFHSLVLTALAHFRYVVEEPWRKGMEYYSPAYP